MAIDVSTGTTITFGTSSWTGAVQSIDSLSFERQVKDRTHLGTTTFRAKAPGDLQDAGGLTVRFFFDPDDPPPITAAVETITLTFPIPVGKSAGATLAGTAFVSSYSFSVPEADEDMTAEMTIIWTGATGPTFTDSSV